MFGKTFSQFRLSQFWGAFKGKSGLAGIGRGITPFQPLALPLIALPGTSPNIATGRRRLAATLAPLLQGR